MCAGQGQDLHGLRGLRLVTWRVSECVQRFFAHGGATLHARPRKPKVAVLVGVHLVNHWTEKEEFIDNQQVTASRQVQHPVGKHRLWALATQHLAASNIPPLSVCFVKHLGGHRGAQTSVYPSQSSSLSLVTARPVGCDLRPWDDLWATSRKRLPSRCSVERSRVVYSSWIRLEAHFQLLNFTHQPPIGAGHLGQRAA